ncbi:hypothetical protein D3273_26570 [Lichenibacterium minor]|uniref:Uncharacterized protein n=1 Tax=Lichenibacterium minor TaxID=2316528 RepID=A0A4Q2TXX3_9HYPH|nr:hypothetical protein [Lichenibacterium minor]RYC28949.1 hypothetical protein D3273_26570 [Lichenibacterium minor]
MSDRDQQIAEFWEEFWDLEFEAPRPCDLATVKRDRDRTAAINKALADLGSDVGARPSDLPAGNG